MASAPNFKRIYEGLKIIAKSTATAVGLGEFEVSSVTSKVSYHNGTTASPVVTEEHPATLISKSMSGVDNTFTEIKNPAISATAGIEVSKLEQIGDGQIITGVSGINTIVTPSWRNAQIASDAQIEVSKLENITPGHILMGATGLGVITATPMSGKIIITPAGQTGINPAELLVDADIDPGADILRTKLLYGTPNVILANDAFGGMNETIITQADLEAAAGDSVLTTVTLTNNATTNFIVTPHATNNVLHIQYSIVRGATYEAGLITVVTDGTNSSIAQGGVVTIGDVGVTMSVLASGANLNVRGTATNTGSDATIKFKQATWLS